MRFVFSASYRSKRQKNLEQKEKQGESQTGQTESASEERLSLQVWKQTQKKLICTVKGVLGRLRYILS